MATGKITKREVEAINIPRPGKRAYLWDDTLKGFGVMVTDKGKRSYIIQYRVGGRGSPTRRVTIGGHGNPWTAHSARDYASELLEQVRRKVDPFELRKLASEQQKAEKQREVTITAQNEKLAFSVVAARFIEAAKSGGLSYNKRHRMLKSWRGIELVIQRDLTPILGNRPLPEITADEITELLEGLSERGAAARHAYSALSGVIRFANHKHRSIFPPSASPLRDVPRPASGEERDRHLAEHELRLVWQAAEGLGWPFGNIYKLLILTGQRMREVAHAPWSEFDLNKRQWLIDGSRTKNGRANLVQLCDTAVDIISELPRLASDGGFLFTTNSKTPVSGFSRAKSRIDQLISKQSKKQNITVDDWRAHDLRRTLAVGCQEMGVKLEVIEELLNHKTGSRSGVVGVYQVYDFQREKRAAWEAWEKRILEIADEKQRQGNVVSIVGQ